MSSIGWTVACVWHFVLYYSLHAENKKTCRLKPVLTEDFNASMNSSSVDYLQEFNWEQGWRSIQGTKQKRRGKKRQGRSRQRKGASEWFGLTLLPTVRQLVEIAPWNEDWATKKKKKKSKQKGKCNTQSWAKCIL